MTVTIPDPLSYAERERIKEKASRLSGDTPQEQAAFLLLTLLAHYERSRDAAQYNGRPHPDLSTYAQAYLAAQSGPPGHREARRILIALIGLQASPELPRGLSYWGEAS